MQQWPWASKQRATLADHGDLGEKGGLIGQNCLVLWPALGLDASTVQASLTTGPRRVAVTRLQSLGSALGNWLCAKQKQSLFLSALGLGEPLS